MASVALHFPNYSLQ
jgi:RNase H-like domain found in reverse transcriptase